MLNKIVRVRGAKGVSKSEDLHLPFHFKYVNAPSAPVLNCLTKVG